MRRFNFLSYILHVAANALLAQYQPIIIINSFAWLVQLYSKQNIVQLQY